MSVYPLSGTPFGYQQITPLTGSTALTVPAGATSALISVSGQAVRLRSDGTAPTASVGYPLPVGAEILLVGNLSVLKFIQTAVAATLDVLYFK